MSAAKKPRAADVARWVETLAEPIGSFSSHASMVRAGARREKARALLRSHGLNSNGQPVKAVGT